MFKENRNLLIIALIAIVNALGYGIIIPILYSYSQQFGLTDFQNGLLFAIFSLCQFLATPIIGRLSDKYGRKPLLLISIAGTALSFFMTAFAPTAIILFIARALDGITAGNIPVAQAVISDTTSPENRAKGFGIIGASFGFGFIFGPVISALTVGISPSLPFIIAGVISVIAVVITWIFLPETNKHKGEVSQKALFDFSHLFHALLDKKIGITLLITLFYFWAFFIFIYGFQPASVKIYHLTPTQIGFLFSGIGLLGLLAQIFVLPKANSYLGPKKAFSLSLLLVTISFLTLFLFQNLYIYILVNVFIAIPNSMIAPLINTILSRETDAKSQGTIMGVNASYMSIGQIMGPIVGGAVASIAIPFAFLAAAGFCLLTFFLSFQVLKPGVKKESVI